MHTVTQAINALRKGKMIILVDDQNRENEGDLVIAAEHATPSMINFMLTYARGIVCFSMSEEKSKQLQLNRLSTTGHNSFNTPFAMTFDAAQGITTGVSAAERSHSICMAAKHTASPNDLVTPGHISSLVANPLGVLVRRGHTEGSVDLMRLAGMQGPAVICEILNEDGSMARGPQLEQFSKRHKIPIISIEQIVLHRKQHEEHLARLSTIKLPTQSFGKLTIQGFINSIDQSECLAIYSEKFTAQKNTLIRIHSSCFTGDLLQSLRCDCGGQLAQSLRTIVQENGVLIYMNQEGRGIGLARKIESYALQEKGLDTVEANLALGFKEDERDYWLAAQVLKGMKLSSIKLMTNNPNKINQLKKYDIRIIKRVPILIAPVQENLVYLKTKQKKLGHFLHL